MSNKLLKDQILVSKWGYDQTNVDFYQVTKEAEEGRFAEIKQICGKWHSNAGRDAQYLMPVPYSFFKENGVEKVFKKKVKVKKWSGNEPYVSLTSYSNAYIWKGNPVMQTEGH